LTEVTAHNMKGCKGYSALKSTGQHFEGKQTSQELPKCFRGYSQNLL